MSCKIYWRYIPPNEIRERIVYCCDSLRNVVEKGETLTFGGGAQPYRIVHGPHHYLAKQYMTPAGTSEKITICPFCGSLIEEIEE